MQRPNLLTLSLDLEAVDAFAGQTDVCQRFVRKLGKHCAGLARTVPFADGINHRSDAIDDAENCDGAKWSRAGEVVVGHVLILFDTGRAALVSSLSRT